jgi:hypothetical protein
MQLSYDLNIEKGYIGVVNAMKTVHTQKYVFHSQKMQE